MSAIANHLAELNAVRIDLGMSPLKSWKESAAKLYNALEKLTAQKASLQAAPSIEKAIEENLKANAKIARVEKIEGYVKPSKRPENAPKKVIKRTQTKIDKATKLLDRAQGTIVNVSSICKELKLNPKVARATLRRMKIDRTDEKAIRAALSKKK